MIDAQQDLFVFEMANNHGGSVDHGLAIIDAVARLADRFGIRAAVKLQYRELDSFIHPDFRHRSDVPHLKRFIETRLSDNDRRALIEAIRAAGLIVMVTPFDEASVRACLDHNVDIIKVASCSVDDWPLLRAVAATDRPVVVSTAGASMATLDRVMALMSARVHPCALMHCVGVYPCAPDAAHMARLTALQQRYPGTVVGYSGHEAPDDVMVVCAAVSRGATILERHIGIESPQTPLNQYSVTPDQAARWIEAARVARAINAEAPPADVVERERASLRSLARGVFVARAVEPGDVVTGADVFFAMPCLPNQMTSGAFDDAGSRVTATRAYAAGDPLAAEH